MHASTKIVISIIFVLSGLALSQTALAQKPGAGAPAAASGGLNHQLDQIIAADSTSWLFWRYDHGSTRNARIEQNNPSGVSVIYGEYTYNGGSRGWVRVRLNGDQVQCIEFWNEGRCRPFRSPPSHGVVSGLLGAMAESGSSGGSSSSSSSGSVCRTETRQICPPDGSYCRTYNEEVCN